MLILWQWGIHELEQHNPQFPRIILDCINELEIKFKDYGNTWEDGNQQYWFERINNEIDEYHKAIGLPARRRKLLNIINMCAMNITNIDEGRIKE